MIDRKYRLSLFAVPDGGDGANEAVSQWLERWGTAIEVVTHYSGGFEHFWNVLVSEDAARDAPSTCIAWSQWSQQDEVFQEAMYELVHGPAAERVRDTARILGMSDQRVIEEIGKAFGVPQAEDWGNV